MPDAPSPKHHRPLAEICSHPVIIPTIKGSFSGVLGFTSPPDSLCHLDLSTPNKVGFFTGHWSMASKMYQEQFEAAGSEFFSR